MPKLQCHSIRISNVSQNLKVEDVVKLPKTPCHVSRARDTEADHEPLKTICLTFKGDPVELKKSLDVESLEKANGNNDRPGRWSFDDTFFGITPLNETVRTSDTVE
jgi:hypothetical protein